MALSVISQHYYKDNELQFMSCIIDAELYSSAYEQLKSYIANASYTGAEANIESLSASKIRKFNSSPPSYGENIKRGGFLVTVTFARPDTP